MSTGGCTFLAALIAVLVGLAVVVGLVLLGLPQLFALILGLVVCIGLAIFIWNRL